MPSGKGAALLERSTPEETGSWKKRRKEWVRRNVTQVRKREEEGMWVFTSESPLGAPATLFSVDSMGLSEAVVGPSSYSPPRGIVFGDL